MTEKRPSVIAVTEKGITRYGMAGNYGGLVGITLRLLINSQDKKGNSVPYFERLVPIKEVEKDKFQDYADRPADADELFCFAQINVDKNIICIDEDMKEQREYHEYPLDLLLEEAARLRVTSPYSSYGTINKKILYSVMNSAVKSVTQNQGNEGKNPSQAMMEHIRLEEKMPDSLGMKGMEPG